MGILFGIIVVFALFIFWAGYVAATLWGWFVVPLGVVAISYWHAVGLVCVAAAFIGIKSDEDIAASDSLGEGVAKACVKSFLMPALVLCIGWLVHSQMPAPQKTWVPGAPGIPSKVMSSIVDNARETASVIDRKAWDYISDNVVCDHGAALVATKTRDSIEHVSYVPVKNVGPQGSEADQVECGPAGFKVGGKKLSLIEVAVFAMDSAKNNPGAEK